MQEHRGNMVAKSCISGDRGNEELELKRGTVGGEDIEYRGPTETGS